MNTRLKAKIKSRIDKYKDLPDYLADVVQMREQLKALEKVAVIVSGCAKNWSPAQIAMNRKHLDYADIYCSLHLDNERNVEEFIYDLQPKAWCFEDYWSNPEIAHLPAKQRNFASMFKNNYNAFELIKKSGIKYDWIIKIRPDSRLSGPFTFNDDTGKFISVPTCTCEWFPADWCNDQIAYGNYESMEIYCNLHLSRDNYNLEIPERTLMSHLTANGVKKVHNDYIYNN